jgi:hypothetical protein
MGITVRAAVPREAAKPVSPLHKKASIQTMERFIVIF